MSALPKPICAGCNRHAADIPGYADCAAEYFEPGFKPRDGDTLADAYAREDGTYNPDNGHFMCDKCYVAAGCPASPAGWVGGAMRTVIRIYGASMTDSVFTITLKTGETVTWNVTRLAAAAKAGEFGSPLYFATADLPPSDWSEWNETDRIKVDAIKGIPDVLDSPAIAIESPNPDFLICCIADGQHRITARQELGLPECPFYLVPLSEERRFRVDGFDAIERELAKRKSEAP